MRSNRKTGNPGEGKPEHRSFVKRHWRPDGRQCTRNLLMSDAAIAGTLRNRDQFAGQVKPRQFRQVVQRDLHDFAVVEVVLEDLVLPPFWASTCFSSSFSASFSAARRATNFCFVQRNFLFLLVASYRSMSFCSLVKSCDAWTRSSERTFRRASDIVRDHVDWRRIGPHARDRTPLA